MTSEKGEGSGQEKWEQKFVHRTTRVGFSANGMFVESLAEVDLDGQVNEFKLYGILVF